MDIAADIRRLARERDAIILAHNYQRGEVQDVADFTGDSLELATRARDAGAPVIVFCGVHFMAETARILSPRSRVIIPRADAGCPMADMVTAERLAAEKMRQPGRFVVTYVNSSAAVKALSDACCTSSNAVAVVRNCPSDKVLFVPDRNLGSYVGRFVKKDIELWKGFCPTHERLVAADVAAARAAHPEAVVLVHPECRPDVVDMADEALSTSGIIRYCRESARTSFIIGTEEGILHRLRNENPGKRFVLASERLVCPNMKLTNLADVHAALADSSFPAVTVPDDVADGARRALERMYALAS